MEQYINENNVPRNALLEQGYKSVGDWHSTQKSGEGDEGERAGRWAGRDEKTECGLHEDYFAMRIKMLKEKVCCNSEMSNIVADSSSFSCQRETELREKDEARGDTVQIATQEVVA